MNYNDIVKHLAPCGLNCSRCADFEHGQIRKLSTELLHALGNNYGRVAKMKSSSKNVFDHYQEFEEILSSFIQASCSGCRGENNLCPLDCHAKKCSKEKGVDFCFQCEDYPCDKQSGTLRKMWMGINDRMKEIGVVEYYLEQANLPRY